MDLVVTTSPIKQQDFIKRAIDSVYHMNFDKRFIICDGISDNCNENVKKIYRDYIELIKKNYPTFEIIESKEHKWFIGSIKDVINRSTADSIFCIQHDVVLEQSFCPRAMWDSKPSDAGILFFPHKQLDTKMSHHWYPMIENHDDDYFKILGWSERVFIFDRQHMIKILNIYNHKKFIEFICHNQLKTKFAGDNLDVIWDVWKCYCHKHIHHKHLVGKTLK